MMKKIVPALAAAAIASVVATSGAHAAVINFAVSVLDGAALGFTGSTLDKSSAFNFDGASLLVSSTGAGGRSWPGCFPGLTIDCLDCAHECRVWIGIGRGSARCGRCEVLDRRRW